MHLSVHIGFLKAWSAEVSPDVKMGTLLLSELWKESQEWYQRHDILVHGVLREMNTKFICLKRDIFPALFLFFLPFFFFLRTVLSVHVWTTVFIMDSAVNVLLSWYSRV